MKIATVESTVYCISEAATAALATVAKELSTIVHCLLSSGYLQQSAIGQIFTVVVTPSTQQFALINLELI